MNVILKPGGLIALPQDVLFELDLEPGDAIAIKHGADGEVTLVKAPAAEASRPTRDEIRRQLEAAIGAAGPGPSTDGYMTLMRGDD